MKSKAQIIPAILTEHTKEMTSHLAIAKEIADSVHLDLIDPDFCDGHSLPIEQWPHIDTRYSEVHVMAHNPISYLEQIKAKGITRAIVHIESSFDLSELTRKAKELDVLIGFAVNPDTDLAKLKPFYGYSNYIQVMGVHPGHYGQKMDPLTTLAVSFLKKIPTVKLSLSVDGGVNLDNITQLRGVGCDYFVCNSSIFTEGEPKENYDKLLSALKNELHAT